jgi:CheY-like chemotaxis protein
VTTQAQILVVEDEPVTARLLFRLLRGAGYVPVFAFSCAAARIARGPFAVAVLDIDLGDGDGVSLAEELLAARTARQIVFHSATLDVTRQTRARRLGVIVNKTGQPEHLLQAIRDALAL